MKKLLFLAFFALFYSYHLKAVDLNASVSFATFKTPEQSYVEIYLQVVGKSVEFITTDSIDYNAEVEVIILFKQGDEIIKFDKYNLNSPTSKMPKDFIDIKRYALVDGIYDLDVSVRDINRVDNSKTYNSLLTINYESSELLQSDIQLLSSFKADDSENAFVKNGYYMEPLPFNFYNRRYATLSFYNEIYNADKAIGDEFLIRYAIERESNGRHITILLGHKKRKPQAINVALLQMDISKLASGNYRLLVEIRNRANELLSKKSIQFQRSNPFLNPEHNAIATIDLRQEFVGELSNEELRYCLKAIAPKVKDTNVEMLNTVIKEKNPDAQRRFLFNYWVNENPNNPEIIFAKYMEVARAIDVKYRSGFGYGFETDRGYYYLKYGQPDNAIAVENEPTAPPYEMWIYYDFPTSSQKNVKFVFYNPSLATNDFRLLHSTARGEQSNPQWEVTLYSDDTNSIQATDFDSQTVNDGYNRNARRYFNDL